MKDELAERRQHLGNAGRYRWEPSLDDRAHPNCRCMLTPLDPPDPRSFWQRFKDWRSRRRAEQAIRGYYADLRGLE